MSLKVERYKDGSLKSICGCDIEVRIERYSDGKFKSAYTSSKQHETWIDENGVFRSMNKDQTFDRLLRRILRRGSDEANESTAEGEAID